VVSNSIKVRTVVAGIAVVLATELAGWRLIQWPQLPPLAVVGFVRVTQITAIIWIMRLWEQGMNAIGWAPGAWLNGLKKGAAWSLAFAAAAGIGMAAVHMAGGNFLGMIRSPLPSRGWELALFFMVGGVIAPIAEEIFFRGILYTYFRRWGIVCALAVSTAIFVALHAPTGIPITQIVGGLVFAAAYETTGNLTVPMTIHCLGNLAIFGLSLL
jgi:uncharacterized protein